MSAGYTYGTAESGKFLQFVLSVYNVTHGRPTNSRPRNSIVFFNTCIAAAVRTLVQLTCSFSSMEGTTSNLQL